jgi:hypothetical protein
VVVDRGRRLRQQADERILNHVAGVVGIAHQARGITQKRGLELLDGGADKRGIFMGAVGR